MFVTLYLFLASSYLLTDKPGYCGNVLNVGSVPAALTDCSFICPGNPLEYCGAGNRLELYQLTPTISSGSSTQSSTTSPTTLSGTVSTTSTSTSVLVYPTLAIKPTIGNFTFQGCYTEATGQRALNAVSYYDYPAMTLEECAGVCASYTYWGVEYGGECKKTLRCFLR